MTLLIDLYNGGTKFQQHMREERLHPVSELTVTNAGTKRVEHRLDIEAVPIAVQG